MLWTAPNRHRGRMGRQSLIAQHLVQGSAKEEGWERERADACTPLGCALMPHMILTEERIAIGNPAALLASATRPQSSHNSPGIFEHFAK